MDKSHLNSKYEFPSYSVLIIHKVPTPSCRQKAASFCTLDPAEMTVGFTRTPRSSKLFWGGESVQRAAKSVPARMMRQESCQLPFSCRSSSYLHNRTAQHPLAVWQQKILHCSTRTVLEHNNKVTHDRFSQSCVFSCYGNRSQEPKSCPKTGISGTALP